MKIENTLFRKENFTIAIIKNILDKSSPKNNSEGL